MAGIQWERRKHINFHDTLAACLFLLTPAPDSIIMGPWKPHTPAEFLTWYILGYSLNYSEAPPGSGAGLAAHVGQIRIPRGAGGGGEVLHGPLLLDRSRLNGKMTPPVSSPLINYIILTNITAAWNPETNVIKRKKTDGSYQLQRLHHCGLEPTVCAISCHSPHHHHSMQHSISQ